MTADLPISVVIPTYNRCSDLKKALCSLEKQSLSSNLYEVIVVDDGSTDGTCEVASQSFTFSFNYVYQNNSGDAQARNTGAQVARGEYLVFIDDDITLEKNCLTNFLAALGMYPQEIILGNLKALLPDPPQPFHYHLEQAFPRRAVQLQRATVDFTKCKSGFMALRRVDYFDIGMMRGLNQTGANAWCDIDFGYRAHKKDYSFYRCMEAIGYHDDRGIRDFWVFCRRCEKTGELGVQLLQKYPELQGEIHTFIDKAPVSLSTDRVVVILRKTFRAVTAWKSVCWIMEQKIRLLERVAPFSSVLPLLYRWTMSSYLYRGFRAGLRKYGLIPKQQIAE